MLLCLPRITSWQERTDAFWFLALVLAWCLFVMWGFVFAWESVHGLAKPLAFPGNIKIWATLPIIGLALGTFLRLAVDPAFRAVFPRDYPISVSGWIHQTLFQLAFVEVFLCYAPLAFFARLCPNHNVVAGLVVGLNVFVLVVKLGTVPELPPIDSVGALFAYRAGVTIGAIWLYRWGGIWPVSLLVLTIQSRHLMELR